MDRDQITQLAMELAEQAVLTAARRVDATSFTDGVTFDGTANGDDCNALRAELRNIAEKIATGKPKDRPVVAMMNFDAVAVLEGRTMGCSTLDGQDVLVRLYTVDELLAAVKRSGDNLEAKGCDRGPGMTRAKAIELTTPIKRA